MGWKGTLSRFGETTKTSIQVFSPLFLLAQVKRVDYKVDNMEGYAQWSLTRSCETVKYKKNNENVEYLTHHCMIISL